MVRKTSKKHLQHDVEEIIFHDDEGCTNLDAMCGACAKEMAMVPNEYDYDVYNQAGEVVDGGTMQTMGDKKIARELISMKHRVPIQWVNVE